MDISLEKLREHFSHIEEGAPMSKPEKAVMFGETIEFSPKENIDDNVMWLHTAINMLWHMTEFATIRGIKLCDVRPQIVSHRPEMHLDGQVRPATMGWKFVVK